LFLTLVQQLSRSKHQFDMEEEIKGNHKKVDYW